MDKFLSDEVAKDLNIDIQPSTTTQLNVKYGDTEVTPGVVLTPTQVQKPPMLSWNVDDPSAFFTVLLQDLDAPSRANPTFREWHHWMVVNLKGSSYGGGGGRGEVMSEYVGSGPPKGSGLHRYVFLLFKHSEKIDFKEAKLTNRSADGRGGHKAEAVMKKYQLGKPVAANYFDAEWDEYVPKLYQQLSGK